MMTGKEKTLNRYPRESDIEKKVTNYAVSQGWLSYKWTSPGHRGVPDRLYFKDGIVKMVEFKAPGKTPTIFQEIIHQKLAHENFRVDIIDDIGQGKILFD